MKKSELKTITKLILEELYGKNEPPTEEPNDNNKKHVDGKKHIALKYKFEGQKAAHMHLYKISKSSKLIIKAYLLKQKEQSGKISNILNKNIGNFAMLMTYWLETIGGEDKAGREKASRLHKELNEYMEAIPKQLHIITYNSENDNYIEVYKQTKYLNVIFKNISQLIDLLFGQYEEGKLYEEI